MRNAIYPSKSLTPVIATIICFALSAAADGAILIWGEGKWGDTWAVSGSQISNPPPERPGVSFNGTFADTNARFAIGLTRNDGTTYTSNASAGETVRIIGIIRPEAEHVGQPADIYVADRTNLVFTMKTPEGIFVPWNARVPDLRPFLEGVILEESLEVDIFTGRLGLSGDHRIFLGYMPADGILRFTPAPERLNITD
ncbi:MAG: hypothetical protein RQ899_11990 [Pseudomonadales bacterium]|nr:hypothetical protein [Pseudomonadales bacterium]